MYNFSLVVPRDTLIRVKEIEDGDVLDLSFEEATKELDLFRSVEIPEDEKDRSKEMKRIDKILQKYVDDFSDKGLTVSALESYQIDSELDCSLSRIKDLNDTISDFKADSKVINKQNRELKKKIETGESLLKS